jgi:hypothetical protein
MPYNQSPEDKLSIPARILATVFAIALILFVIQILFDMAHM